MAHPKPLLIGTKFGRLSVIASPKRPDKNNNGPLVPCACECGNQVERRLQCLRSGHTKSCGCLQKERARLMLSKRTRKAGANHPMWRGGKMQSKAGYIRILTSNHPRTVKGYVAEHILVMEKHIGRYISRSETVHHINGIRDDNRIENLELWDRAHPSGQRHAEKMKFYMGELLKKCDRKMLTEFCSSVMQ